MAAIAGALIAYASAAGAANVQPICASRPGKSTPTCTAPAGHLQLETGLADWTMEKSRGERDTSLVIGETTFKYGLTDRSDIELDVNPWQRTTSRAADSRNRASGFSDLVASYKQQLTSGAAPLQLALQPFVKIPTAGHALGNGKWEAGLLLPIGYAIPKSLLTIGSTPELDWAADADGRGHHAAMAQVVSIGWQLSNKLNLSGDLWGQWDWDPSGTTRQASLDGSVAYLVSNDVQLDAGANLGLNPNTPGLELYTGVSLRF